MGKKDSNGGSASSDARFAAMSAAPMFKKAQHKNQKVKVDDRFKKVLTDERFRANVGKVDKYGREKGQNSNKTEAIKELQEFYDVDDDVDDNGAQESAVNNTDSLSRLDYLTKLSRGELEINSESDSDESDAGADGPVQESALAVAAGEEVEKDEVTSNRLAVQNCDWESVTAQDLMVILQSFCPSGKSVRSVTIYPSDFGLKAMAEEAKYGPQHIWKNQNKSATDDNNNEDDDVDGDEDDSGELEADSDEDNEEEEEEEEEDGASESEESKTESELAREQQENDEALEDIYKELKGDKKKMLTVKQLEKWEDVQNLLSEQIITLEDLHSMIRDVLADTNDDDEEEQQEEVEVSGSTKLSLDQFKAVVAMLDEAEVELGAAADLEEQQEEDEEGEEDDNDDLYEGIEQLSDEEQQSENSDEGNDDDGSDENEDDDDNNRRKRSKEEKAGDFRRRKGAVGLVLQDDLEERGKARKEKQQQNRGENDYDEVALRKYELSKLRYYFAVVECDDSETANVLYTQLDSIELEHSSMVFDMRFIPDEVSFESRAVKEVCKVVPQSYKPPEFVINALQHTKVQCSWDEGEKNRERKLTNISQWRNLNQSELQQYIASSDSEDESEEEEHRGSKKSSKKMAGSRKADKASKLRSLLLGGAGGSGSDSEGHENNESEDDFFSNSKSSKSRGKSEEQEEEEEGEKWMTFMPEEDSKGHSAGKTSENETPYEAMKRKEAEKKKLRKEANKQQQDEPTSMSKAAAVDDKVAGKVIKSRYVGKNGPLIAASAEESKEEREKRQAQLQLMFNNDNEDSGEDESAALSRDRLTHDLRKLAKEEKRKAKKMKKLGQKGETAVNNDTLGTVGDDFKVDVKDDRFKSLFDGSAKFGIDMTSTEYKETAGVKQILSEQRKRREEQQKHGGGSAQPSKKSRTEEAAGAVTSSTSEGQDAGSLANKLKRKLGGK